MINRFITFYGLFYLVDSSPQEPCLNGVKLYKDSDCKPIFKALSAWGGGKPLNLNVICSHFFVAAVCVASPKLRYE